MVDEADAASLLPQIEEDTAALLRDPRHRRVQLLATVAAQRSERVAGQTLGVDAHEHGLAVGDVAHRQCDVVGLGVPEARLVAVYGEVAVARRELGARDTLDELLARHAV